MVRDTDDDALAWDGDDDPTLDAPKKTVPLPDGYEAVGKGAVEFEERVAATQETDKQPMSSAMLLVLGVLGGVYLLYTIGWVIGGLRLEDQALFVVTPAMYLPAFVLAVGAPAIWFLTTYLLTRGGRPWLRVVWLVVGALLLVPWPFIMVGAVGA